MTFRPLIVVIATAILIGGCESNPTHPQTPEEIQEELERNGPPEFQQLKAAYAHPLHGIDERTRNERLKVLLTKFSATKDEFNHRVTYRHNTFSRYYNDNGTTLRAEIIDGTFYLDSAYVGEDWIFEKSFTVKVGDKQITASDDSPKHDNDGGITDELIDTYDARAVVMASLIADASGEPVRVRLTGERYMDYTLSEPYRKAIIETLELWKLLGGSSATWIPSSWLKSE